MPEAAAPVIQHPRSQSRLFPRAAVWVSMTLAVLCLLAAGGWFGGRWWVKRCLAFAVPGYSPITGKVETPEAALERFRTMPDFLLCPVLVETIRTNNNNNQVNAALAVLQDRAFCGQGVIEPCPSDFMPPEPKPEIQKWISRLPRRMLEDLYVANHPNTNGWAAAISGGDELIWVYQPKEARWHKTYSLEECKAAATRLATGDYEW